MAENVGEIFYNVTLETGQMIDGARKVQRETERLETAFNSVAKAVASFAAAMSIAATVRDAVNAARAYEKTLADLSAITGVAGEGLVRLSGQAQDLAKSSTASSVQVIEAMKLIASAKPELLETSGALAAVTKEAIALAEASGMQLPAAAEAVTLALNQFGVGADQAGRFVNVLAAGAKFGASEIADTAIALKNSAVSAAAAGVSFEETNAALQALAAGGIKGGEAGTSLRNVLLKLENETDKKLKPSIVGLAGALENLSAKNLSSTTLTKMFGLENVNAAQALIGSAAAVKTLTTQLTGTNTAYEQAAIQTNTLDGAIKRMNSAIEMAAQTLGNQFLPLVKSGANAIQSLANDFAAGTDTMRAASAVATVAVASLAGILSARLLASVTGMVAAYSAKVAATQAATNAEIVALRSAEALALANAQNASIAKAAALAQAEQAAATLALTRAEIALAAADVERAGLAAALAVGTQAQAAQTLILQIASTRLTAARVAETEASAAAAVAERALAVARSQAYVAAGAATVATGALTTATAAATAATGLAAGASRAFGVVMSALGGPIGIGITALVLLAWNWDSLTKKAGDAAQASEEAAARISASLRKSSDIATKELRTQLADVQKEIDATNKVIADAQQAPLASEGGMAMSTLASDEDIAALYRRRDALVKAAEDIRAAITNAGSGAGGGRGVVNPETVRPTRQQPAADPELQAKRLAAKAYYDGLLADTKGGIERIATEERRALDENAKRALEDNANADIYGKARVAIEEKYRQQRIWLQIDSEQKLRASLEKEAQDRADAEKRFGEEQRKGLDMAAQIRVADDPVARLQLELQAKSDLLRQYAEADRANEEIYSQARVQLEQQTAAQIASIYAGQLAGYSSMLASAASATEGFSGKQTALYKGLFAASKAFAIAESIIKIQQGIAGAAALPFPANIPAIGAVVAATSSIISTISGTNFGGGRQYGGPVSAGSMYRINETGAPEMYTGSNGAQYMLPNQAGSVTPADKVGGRAVPTIIIQNMGTPQQVQSQSYDSGTDTATLVMADLVEQFSTNTGPAWNALRSSSNVQGRL